MNEIEIIFVTICMTIAIMTYLDIRKKCKVTLDECIKTKQQCVEYLASAQNAHNSIVEGLAEHSRQLERLKQTVEVMKPRLKA